jgi:hypothetical protein
MSKQLTCIKCFDFITEYKTWTCKCEELHVDHNKESYQSKIINEYKLLDK